MAKEINLNLKKEEMDTIINQQKAEQVRPLQSEQSKQHSDIQQIIQGMQMQEMQLRLNLMREELISKQVSNINNIATVIGMDLVNPANFENPLRKSLNTLLQGYAIDDSKPEPEEESK